MPGRALIPASLAFPDGIPCAEEGEPARARHVFLGGSRLPERWRGRRHFTILETGFGFGLNFLATWLAWRDDPARPRHLHYVAMEKHPFSAAELAQLHARWPELAELSQALRAVWPPLVSGFHRLLLDRGQLVLTLVFGDIVDCLPQIDANADAFYLGGFGSGGNHGVGALQALARLHRLARPDATLAACTVPDAVCEALAQAGFDCEKLPGFGHERDMLAARFTPRWQLPLRPVAGERSAIVIGAGIAGSAICERLAARGWQLTLIERHDKPAQEASGNLAGIVMPLLSKDDNLVSRLARAAYLFAVHMWRHLGGIGDAFAGEACGVLQLARDAAHAQMQRDTVEAWRYPPEFARWLDAAAVSRLIGTPALHGGWLFPQGGWVTPASLCNAMLAACGKQLDRRFTQNAIALERLDGGWRVRDSTRTVIAQAPVAIIANGTGAIFFPQTQELPLTAIRGQVTHLPADMLPALPFVLCGEAYVTRPVQGFHCVGASYDFDSDPELRRASHAENLARLVQVLPQADPIVEDMALAGYALPGRVGFRCVSPDRLPLVGALPDQAAPIGGSRLRDVPRLQGLHGLLAYGSRGLIWAPFAAELLASQLEGEPLPIEQELAAALDPARFALKAHRRSG